jgi:hypothetical protein
MRESSFETFLILGLLVVSVYAVIHEFYMSWFRPSYFREYSSKRVKDWWPFATFYRHYYASTSWLWIVRITMTVFLPFLAILVYKLLYGQLSLP